MDAVEKTIPRLPKPGTYNIEIDEVLKVGESYFAGGSEEVIIRDTKGKTWSIPEDVILSESVITRYDVKKGMKLRITVAREDGEKEITEAIVL